MKRRVSAAVLFVLALVALVAIGCGGTNRQDAETIKGKPWAGTEGRTVSVAKLASARFQERRRTGVAAGQEAVEPKTGTEAAQAERVGQNVREKPEPGEEGTAAKRAAPAAAQQRTGEAAITPSQAVTPGPTNFLGARLNESGFIPPDSMGAVGPSQILVSVNGRIKAFDKQGNPDGLNMTDSDFWAPVCNCPPLPSTVNAPTDPGVEYDRLSHRWIVSAINTESSNNRIMLAVSNGPTITPTDSFTYYFFNEASPPPTGPARFADYPQLGVDANAIYIGVNEFASSSGSFTGTSAYVIRKSSVINGGPIVVTAFRNLVSGSGPGPDSPQPATDMDPNVGAGYIVGPDNQQFSRIDVRRISNPGGTPTISGNLTVTVPATALPLSVPAQGTPSPGLDPLDDRLFEAMIGRDPDGNVSLWTAHNIRMTPSGVGSSIGTRDGSRWYQIGSLDSSPSLTQSGQVFDNAATNPAFYWMPSIAMNGQGHASINMSVAGTTRHAEVASSGRLFGDAAGTTETPVITRSSTFTYDVGADPPNPERWGDYSQTVVDPSDNMTFWTFQEYADANNSWGVQVIQLQAPPPAAPSGASPTSVTAGSCSTAVEVTGTSTDGSGFFDPGPDFEDRIAADVTGGVAVNHVTYVDPTHVILDLDTRVASTGPQDVTITNPDGQQDSATGLLTVDPAGTGPSVPCLTGTDPVSPANQTSPKVLGFADPGTTVTLYTDDACTPGNEAGSGSAAQFASPGITVTPPVGTDSTTDFYATATDGIGTSACSADLGTPSGSVNYVEDSTLPNVVIDSGPTGLTNDRTPTFTFGATDTVGPVSFQCSIDTGGAPSFGACSGPGTSDTPASPLANGSYTFRVKATDAADNSATATQTFQVDATPPSVAITSGPSGTTTDQTPTFTFSASDSAGLLAVQCSIDTGAASFGSCSGPGNSDTPSSPLADGSYVFRAQAFDLAGNSAVASRSFVVQVPQPQPQPSAPETKITKGPKKTRNRRPKFKFISDQAGSSFRCRLDKGKFRPCTSPFRPPKKLKPGKHKLKVRAIGPTGVADPAPAVKKFKVVAKRR